MAWVDVFKPKPLTRAGYNFAFSKATIGTGGITVAPTATTSLHLAIPRTKVSVQNLALNWLTAAAGSAAITVQVFKVDSANNATALCSATSIKNDVLTGNAKNIALAVTASLFDGAGNATRIVDGSSGESIRVDVVAAGTVTTAPQVVVAAELTVLQ